VVGRRGHAVEAVPCEDGAPAVAYALGHVAAFVVAIAGAGVVLQQVVQQLAGRVSQGIVGRGRIDDVACGVEGEGLASEAAVGFEQAAHGVVAVVQAASAAVADGHQLASLVVGIAALDAGSRLDGARLGAGNVLFEQPARRVVLLPLAQSVALLACNLPVQVVALEPRIGTTSARDRASIYTRTSKTLNPYQD